MSTTVDNQASYQADAPESVKAILTRALSTLTPENAAAAALLVRRAQNGTLQRHMPDGAIAALADELVKTCQEPADED